MATARAFRGRVVVDEDNVLDDAVVVVDGASIAFVGSLSHLPERFGSVTTESVPLLTAGLVDAHTHAAWVGSRHLEYEQKLRGEGYEAIAAAGGGIVSSMRAIEEVDIEQIAATLRARLRRMAALGVTTVEVKSGYGLRPNLERRQLRAIAIVAKEHDLPRIVPTLLALHALPPEARGDVGKRASFIADATTLVRNVAREGLARFVDAYVDRNAFSVEEARGVARAAQEVGLGVRLHVGQFADVGGAELAAEVSAASADHLEIVGARGLEAMARADVAATLLPTAAFVLGQAPPDVAAIRAAGIRIIVASDANPGTSPTESLPLAMAFAARSYGLSLAEVIAGVTHHAARSLDLRPNGQPAGRLVEGAPADLVAWDLPHEAALLQPWGTPRTLVVLRDGIAIADSRQKDRS